MPSEGSPKMIGAAGKIVGKKGVILGRGVAPLPLYTICCTRQKKENEQKTEVRNFKKRVIERHAGYKRTKQLGKRGERDHKTTGRIHSWRRTQIDRGDRLSDKGGERDQNRLTLLSKTYS